MGRPKKIKKDIIERTFEECYPEICKLIEKRRFRWQLTSINWMDWDDVKQNLLKHIFIKWELYHQEKKLSSWVNTVINNQMINMIRNFYGNFKKPCVNCEFYQEENGCAKFGEVSTKCDLYRTWVYGKKTKHDIQLPLSMENYSNEVFEIRGENVDVERTGEILHKKMKEILKPFEYTIYKALFIDHKSEEEVGKSLKFKSREPGRYSGYKQVATIKKSIMKKVKQVLNSGDVEIISN